MSTSAVMVCFYPEFKGKVKQVPVRFHTLVVDRSGSMSGEDIKKAAETRMLFLKSLPKACSVTIVGLGSRMREALPRERPVQPIPSGLGCCSHGRAES